MVNITIENTNVCSYIIEALVPYYRYTYVYCRGSCSLLQIPLEDGWRYGGICKGANFFKYSAEVQGLEVQEIKFGKSAGCEKPAQNPVISRGKNAKRFLAHSPDKTKGNELDTC